MLTLIKSSVASFFWGFFQWFYTAGDGCGFGQFPALGLAAYQNRYPSSFFFFPVLLSETTSNQPWPVCSS